MSLREYYNKEVTPRLMKEFSYHSVMQVPRLVKVTLNASEGQSLQDEKVRDNVVASLTRISGQRPVLTLAKKSISSFKIRQGLAIGVKVTLRGRRMYDFVEKFVKVALPRTRDFRGLSPASCDGTGNATFGIREHLVFPEINPDQVDRVYGLEVCITTTAKNDAEGLALLKALGFPFRQAENSKLKTLNSKQIQNSKSK